MRARSLASWSVSAHTFTPTRAVSNGATASRGPPSRRIVTIRGRFSGSPVTAFNGLSPADVHVVRVRLATGHQRGPECTCGPQLEVVEQDDRECHQPAAESARSRLPVFASTSMAWGASEQT